MEVSEFTGRIRFGVLKHHSFLSFVGEPYSRFTVHSEVGSQYKVRNLPKLSSIIIKKIKNNIRKKFVHPGAYKFRLVWPRSWWPEGAPEPSPKPTVSTTATTDDISPSIVNPADGSLTPADMTSPTRVSVVTETTKSTVEEHEALSSPSTAEKVSNSRKILDGVSVRDQLARWFHRGSKSRKSTEGSDDLQKREGEGENDDEEKWRRYMDVARRQYTDDSGRPDVDYHNIRSCVSTTELLRKQVDYPRIHDIFAPLNDDSPMTVRIRPRAHTIGDFRSSSIEDAAIASLLNRSRDADNDSSRDMNIPHDRTMDDSDMEIRSRMGWLKKIRNEKGSKLSTSLLGLKSKLITRLTFAEEKLKEGSHNTPDAEGRAGRGRAGSTLGGLALMTSDTLCAVAPSLAMMTSRSAACVQPQGEHGTSLALGEPPAPMASGNVTASGRGGARSSLFRFGRKILEAKESLKNGISKTVDRRKKNPIMLAGAAIACVSYQSEDPEQDEDSDHSEDLQTNHQPQHSDSSRHSTTTEPLSDSQEDTSKRGRSFSRLGGSIAMMSGALSRRNISRGSNSENTAPDLEQEAMSLAWQARAQAMSLAAEEGELPSMQGFLRTPLKTSVKVWVVLRSGALAIFPNSQSDSPIAVYNLGECVCRPSDQLMSFELGVVDKSGHRWVSFYAESDVQCRAWVMTIQQSAEIPVNNNNEAGASSPSTTIIS